MIDTSTLATHINGKINTIKLFLYKSYREIFGDSAEIDHLIPV